MTPAEAATRPRVEGDRERQIYEATLDVLMDVGYDRLTMDAVATAAHASKATLYRRWSGKAALVVDALLSAKGLEDAPDTGSLRGDLLGMFCGMGGLTDQRQVSLLAGVLTAIARDEEFATAFRTRFVAPKAELSRSVFERARDRGELRPGLDIPLAAAALPGIILHRQFVLGEPADPDAIERVVDQIILPAVCADGWDGAGPKKKSKKTNEKKEHR